MKTFILILFVLFIISLFYPIVKAETEYMFWNWEIGESTPFDSQSGVCTSQQTKVYAGTNSCTFSPAGGGGSAYFQKTLNDTFFNLTTAFAVSDVYIGESGGFDMIRLYFGASTYLRVSHNSGLERWYIANSTGDSVNVSWTPNSNFHIYNFLVNSSLNRLEALLYLDGNPLLNLTQIVNQSNMTDLHFGVIYCALDGTDMFVADALNIEFIPTVEEEEPEPPIEPSDWSISIYELPTKLGLRLNITPFVSGIIISLFILLLAELPFLIFASDSVFLQAVVGLTILGLCTAIMWLPPFVFVIILIMVVLLFVDVIRKRVWH